jgi:hypothetical protein
VDVKPPHPIPPQIFHIYASVNNGTPRHIDSATDPIRAARKFIEAKRHWINGLRTTTHVWIVQYNAVECCLTQHIREKGFSDAQEPISPRA